LLTGGLLVRIQPEEPIFSIICGRPTFRLIFTSPFSKPVLCGFFFGAKKHPDARVSGVTDRPDFLQPPLVQPDPPGERSQQRFHPPLRGTNRAKTLAVPADQRIHLMDVAYELSKPG